MKQFIKYRPIQLVTFLGAFMLSLSACELDNVMKPTLKNLEPTEKPIRSLLMLATWQLKSIQTRIITLRLKIITVNG